MDRFFNFRFIPNRIHIDNEILTSLPSLKQWRESTIINRFIVMLKFNILIIILLTIFSSDFVDYYLELSNNVCRGILAFIFIMFLVLAKSIYEDILVNFLAQFRKKGYRKNKKAYKKKRYGNQIAILESDLYYHHVIMFLLLKLRRNNLNFDLAVEYEPGRRFDDIFLKFQNDHGEWINVFILLRHSSNTCDYIDELDMFGGALDLIDLYESYLKIPEKHGKNVFLLYTNIKILLRRFRFQELPTNAITQLLEVRLKCMTNSIVENYLLAAYPNHFQRIIKFLNQFFIAEQDFTLRGLETCVNAELMNFLGMETGYFNVKNSLYTYKTWIEEWVKSTRGDFIDCDLINEHVDELRAVIKRNNEEYRRTKVELSKYEDNISSESEEDVDIELDIKNRKKRKIALRNSKAFNPNTRNINKSKV